MKAKGVTPPPQPKYRSNGMTVGQQYRGFGFNMNDVLKSHNCKFKDSPIRKPTHGEFRRRKFRIFKGRIVPKRRKPKQVSHFLSSTEYCFFIMSRSKAIEHCPFDP